MSVCIASLVTTMLLFTLTTAAGAEGMPYQSASVGAAPHSPAAPPPTLADPELQQILSHFKHPDDSAYRSSVVPAAIGAVSFYAPYAFGSVRPYWPPVVVAHPPRPVTPFLGPILAPGMSPFLLLPPIHVVLPGS